MLDEIVMGKMILIFLMIVFLFGNAAAQDNVGIIVELKGTARLKQTDGKELRLNGKNFARRLQAGQRLKSYGKGQIQIGLCNNTSASISSNKWYTVPQVICSSQVDSAKRDIILKTFVIAARHRGDGDFILFPTESREIMDMVRPETVMFRWASSTTARVNLSLSMIGEEKTIWEQNDVAGENGQFVSDDLRKILSDVREKVPSAKLQLKIRTTLGTENSAVFQVLPKADEKSLQQEIADLEEGNRLLLCLSRAGIYHYHNLFIEAANEYEEVLKLSPESIDLLRVTSSAQDLAGNLKRKEELDHLIERLSKGTNMPD